MKLYLRLFFLFLSLTLYLNHTSPSYASQLNWISTYSSFGEPTTIKIAPSDRNIVYASLRLTNSFDLLKSTDGGLTWKSIKSNLTDGLDVNWISVYKTNPDVVAISLWNSGAYISEDGGQSWSKISNFSYTRSIEIHPTDVNTIYLGVGGNHGGDSGLYKSIDKGVTWTKFNNLRSDNNAQILIDGSAPETVYADIDPDFFRSYDGGNSWVQLPLYRAYANSILDNRDPNTVYTPSFDIDPGIYKSLDQGNTWNKNISFVGNPFRLTQNETGVIFSSVASGDAGVWQNTDGSASWQNVGDVAWGSSPTWGIDAKGEKIIVGVAGLGIFYANVNPSPAPNPVVFIPGFGASWSYNGLVLNWQTTYKDWSLFPKFTDGYYGPLLTSLQSAGLKTDQNLFTFAYDYRKSITDNAVSLNSFLTNEVATRNASLKANVVAHSMGGIIARQCFEKTIGCSDKINKIVTAGTPHQGLTASYDFWEGGKVVEKDLLRRFSENLIVHLISTPFGSVKDLVQANFPGVRDL
ncbi:MAG: hypothetical protein HY225_00095, partial [Candidatus Vogelbacteria bacterium]|nr:hypothetical protein [Candidatus Vogelbacteria bacterium]